MYIRRHHLHLPPYFDNSKTYLVINILFIKEVLSLGFPWPGLSPPIPPSKPGAGIRAPAVLSRTKLMNLIMRIDLLP